jgi:hypothetical protein
MPVLLLAYRVLAYWERRIDAPNFTIEELEADGD